MGSASEPNADWGAYYNDMGQVIDERSSKTADLEPSPMTGLDSADTDVFDNGGATLETTLKIRKVVASFAAAATFVQALNSLINGDQVPPIYPLQYTSDLLGQIYVKIKKIESDVIVTDGPCMVNYTLELIQSSTVG